MDGKTIVLCLLLFCGSILMADMSGEVPVKNNRLEVYKILKEKNLRPEVIAGLMGNIAVESGDTFDYLKKEDLRYTGDGLGRGRGLFQFTFMEPFYKDYLKKNNLKDSAKNQIDWTLEQINNPKTSVLGDPDTKKLKKIMDEGDVVQVTEGFNNVFERGQPQDRVNKALEIYNNIKKSKAHGGMVMRNYYDYEPRSI